MSQQFFPAELCGRFFLKEPNSKKPTPILFAIRLKGKLCRFTIHTKVYSTQWNQLLQKAYISPILSNMDNQNNMIVNEKIEEIKKRFEAFKLYLCSTNEYDINTIHTLFKDNLAI